MSGFHYGIPSWLPGNTPAKLFRGMICDCAKFCAYYGRGWGGKPSAVSVCPLYFRNRPDVFECVSAVRSLDFVYLPKDTPQLKSAVVKYRRADVRFHFIKEVDADGRLLEEDFILFDDGAIWYSRQPDAEPHEIQDREVNALQKLEDYFSLIVVASTPAVGQPLSWVGCSCCGRV